MFLGIGCGCMPKVDGLNVDGLCEEEEVEDVLTFVLGIVEGLRKGAFDLFFCVFFEGTREGALNGRLEALTNPVACFTCGLLLVNLYCICSNLLKPSSISFVLVVSLYLSLVWHQRIQLTCPAYHFYCC